MQKKIKIYEGRNKKGDLVSQIKLQGKWLEEIGFNTGSVMEVQYGPGKITLTVKTDE